MICLTLFWNFLMIGTLSFGGGYGMISLVREVVLGHGWLTESEFLSFIAVSESTPGPLAVNMATFIGSSQAGLPGALVATLGVVLPSFVIILLVAAVLRSVLRYAGVSWPRRSRWAFPRWAAIRPARRAALHRTAGPLRCLCCWGWCTAGTKKYGRKHHPPLG